VDRGDGGYDGTPGKWVGKDDEKRQSKKKNTRSTEGRVEKYANGLGFRADEKRKQ